MLKQSRTHLKTILSVSLIAVGVSSVSFSAAQAQVVLPAEVAKKTINDFAPRAGFSNLISKVSPAVVHVSISGTPKARQLGQNFDFNFPPGSPFEDFFKQLPRQQPEESKKKRKLGIGSGFLISADGYLITNNHVIDGGDEITITLSDGTEYDGKLVGTDKKTDVAVVKIEAKKSLPFVSWGNDENSRIGDWVLAIGHPFGLEGGASATTGIISARGRDIRSGPYDDYIQVDAAINRGNSGGPLFNLEGQVIGINTAIYSPNGGSVGIGFAIPATLAQTVTRQLMTSGTVERGLIGVQIQAITEELQQGLNLEGKEGALVSDVIKGKPAEKAGLKAGDVIIGFNGKPINQMRELPRVVAETNVGLVVPITVLRNGKRLIKQIEVAKIEEQNTVKKVEVEAKSNSLLGAELTPITNEIKQQRKLGDAAQGVLIVSTERDGLMSKNALRAGDIIQKVGSKTVDMPEDIIELIEKAKAEKRETVAMLIYRDGAASYRAFSVE